MDNKNNNNNYVKVPFTIRRALVTGFIYKVTPTKNGQGAMLNINNSYRKDNDPNTYSSWCTVIFAKATPMVLNLPPHTLVNIICDVSIKYNPENKINEVSLFGYQISVVPTKNITITNTYQNGNGNDTNNNANANASVGSSDYGNNYGNYDFNDFKGNSPY